MERCKLCLVNPVADKLNICIICRDKVTASIGRQHMKGVRYNSNGFVCIICLQFGAKPSETYSKSYCTKCGDVITPREPIQPQITNFKMPAKKMSPVKTIVKPQAIKPQITSQSPIIPLVIEHDIFFAAMILAQIRRK
ncbi:Hypothetical protein PACV_155 [Pacmanvirus A23]|uniref:Hypothetical protein n=1 Tax=Pacmanvirus A23 TaxID=1932881 RepID=UPI000A094D4E|nr:Hypothetical protein B9W72_gp153 [Pacmanvirus A23]SIP85870.1 Hypothetical protein PACV_155 [Pacmanvirus A23]